jgi:hypothetical protein
VATISEVDRSYAQMLGKMARTYLSHLEVEAHLMLGWRSSTHAEDLFWSDVCAIARESWERNAASSQRDHRAW